MNEDRKKEPSTAITCIKRLVQQQSVFSWGGVVNSGATGTEDIGSGRRFESTRMWWIGGFVIVVHSLSLTLRFYRIRYGIENEICRVDAQGAFGGRASTSAPPPQFTLKIDTAYADLPFQPSQGYPRVATTVAPNRQWQCRQSLVALSMRDTEHRPSVKGVRDSGVNHRRTDRGLLGVGSPR